MTFSNSVEERVKNMQIFCFLFAFPALRFASQATKKGFPLYNSVTNTQADLKAHNGSRQMAENLYAIFRFCEFLGFYRLLCVGVLDHIGVINLAGNLAWTGSITSFFLYSYQWGASSASSEYLSQLIPDLSVLVPLYRCFSGTISGSSSLQARIRDLWRLLQVSESSSGGTLSRGDPKPQVRVCSHAAMRSRSL